MRAPAWGLLIISALLTTPPGVQAQEDDAALDLVPVVDPNAPLCAWFFLADPAVLAGDATSLDKALSESLDHRTDVRIMPRAAAEAKLKEADRSLTGCGGTEACLVDLAKLLGVSRLLVANLRMPTPNSLRLELLRLDAGDPPGKLSVRSEGTLAELLAGGAAGSLQALLENRTQPLIASPSEPAPSPTPVRPAPPPPPARTVVERPPEPPQIEEKASSRGFFTRHWASMLSLGTGLVSGALGLTFGVMSQGIADEMSYDPSAQHQFDPDRDRQGKNYALAANVLFGVAGAAALTGAVLFFFFEDDADSSGVTIVPAGLGVGARLRF